MFFFQCIKLFFKFGNFDISLLCSWLCLRGVNHHLHPHILLPLKIAAPVKKIPFASSSSVNFTEPSTDHWASRRPMSQNTLRYRKSSDQISAEKVAADPCDSVG